MYKIIIDNDNDNYGNIETLTIICNEETKKKIEFIIKFLSINSYTNRFIKTFLDIQIENNNINKIYLLFQEQYNKILINKIKNL